MSKDERRETLKRLLLAVVGATFSSSEQIPPGWNPGPSSSASPASSAVGGGGDAFNGRSFTDFLEPHAAANKGLGLSVRSDEPLDLAFFKEGGCVLLTGVLECC